MIPVRLVAQNFLSYEHLDLNLKNRGLVFIVGENLDRGGSNGSGKSSIFDAITWCLFGYVNRGVRNSQICMRNRSDCLVYMELEVGSDLVKIYRHRDHYQYGNKTLLYVNEGDRTGSTDRDTQARINSLLQLDKETFNSVVVFPQRIERFASLSDSQQKEIFDRVLCLDRFGKAKHKVEIMLAKLESNISHLQTQTDSLVAQKAESYKRINELKAADDTFNLQKTTRLAQLGDELVHLKAMDLKVEPWLNQRLIDLNNALNADKLREAKDTAAQAQHNINLLSQEQAKLLERSRNVGGHNRHTIGSLEALVATRKSELALACSKTHAHLSAKNCPTCKQPLPEKEHAVVREQLIKEMDDKGLELEAAKQELANAEEEAAKEEVQAQLTIRNELALASIEITKNQNAINLVEEILRQAQEFEEEAQNINLQLTQQRQRIQEWERDIASKEREIHAERVKESPYLKLIEDEKARYARLEREIQPKLNAIEFTEKEIEYLKFLVTMFGNQGAKSLLLDIVTPQFNAKANEYMSYLDDPQTKITFATQTTLASGDKRDKISIEVDYKHGSGTYAGSSGGEHQRADIAIIFALSDLASSRAFAPVKLKLLDEVFESIDEYGKEAVVRLLNEKVVPQAGTVLVISHDENMASMFQNKIKVVKEGGISRVIEA